MDTFGRSCSIINVKLYLIKLMLIMRIGFPSDLNQDSPIRQINTIENGFAWDPYSRDCCTQNRSFQMGPEEQLPAAPPNTPARSPEPQSSAATDIPMNEFHAGNVQSQSLWIGLPLLPTEIPRAEYQYIWALPGGMSTHHLIIFMFDFMSICPSAIIQKYKGQRQRMLTEEVKVLCPSVGVTSIGRKMARDEMQATAVTLREIMFADAQNPPSALIHSYYITLWSHIDLYYAMNYILNAYCTGFDEVAVVTLLKQLTVSSVSDGIYVNIIKAIWDAIIHQPHLKNAVLQYDNKNVASYSLMTLAVHHMDHDREILTTLMKLFDESLRAKQRVTLATYNCVVRRLDKLHYCFFKKRHRLMMDEIWVEVMPRLPYHQEHVREEWVELMLNVCHNFGLVDLKKRVAEYGAMMRQ